MSSRADGQAHGLGEARPSELSSVSQLSAADYRSLVKANPGLAASLDVLGRSQDRSRFVVSVPPALRVQFETLFQRMGIAPERGFHNVFAAPQALAGYLTPDQVVAKLRELSEAHPDVMKLETIGTTHEGRPIVAVVMERPEGQGPKPTVFFNGMHHAREVMTVEVAVSIVQNFADALSAPAPDAAQTELLDWIQKYRIVVAPQMNPDGNALVHNGRNLWRKNSWKDEGKLVGVDLNRNYPAYWGACNGSSSSKGSDTYRGPSAASEPESQALMRTVERFRPVLGISYHSFSELIIFPYGCSAVKNPSREVFLEIAQGMNRDMVNDDGQKGRYDVGTAPELLYNADGSDLDWQWDQFGVYAYTIEINSQSLGFQPDYKRWRNVTVQNQEGGWRAQIRRLGGAGFSGQLALGGTALESEWEKISYEVEVLDPKGQALPFAFAQVDGAQGPKLGNKRFPLRDETGSFFQLVAPGRYRVSFWKGSEPLLSQEFDVGQRHHALGFMTF